MGPSCVCQIREEIEHFGIKIYQFPDCDSDEDEDFKLQDQALKVWPPQGIPFPSCFFWAEQRNRILYKGGLSGVGEDPGFLERNRDEDIGGKEQVRMGAGGVDRPPLNFFQESIPFAVIGSNTVVEARGRRVRGRLYPWGIVEGKALSL